MKKYEMPNLDALRSFAVCAVMIDHLVPTLVRHLNWHSAFIQAFTWHIGQAGVLAFFVHTSLVLMYSLDRLETKTKAVTTHFYIRRIFRIYPLSIATILMVILLGIPAMTWKATPPLTLTVILANLLLVQNLITKQDVSGPLWSLPYEVQMYVVLPFLHRIAKLRQGSFFITLLIVAASALGVYLSRKTGHVNMLAYAPCFLAGVLCYSLRDKLRAVLPALAWPVFVVALFGVYCFVHMRQPDPVYWIGWLLSFVLGCSINLFRESPFAAWNWITSNIAKYSYGLYLLHVPALYLVFIVLKIRNMPLGIALFFSLSLAASIVTYHALEAPMIELGRRLSDRASLLRPAKAPRIGWSKGSEEAASQEAEAKVG